VAAKQTVEGAKAEFDDYVLDYQRPYLYPKQAAAIFDSRRYSFIEASTKAGKTSGCIVWITERAIHGQEGWNYWWIAPVSGQADIAFRRCLRSIPQEMRSENVTLKTITLLNGAVIWFKSADKPDSLYGEDVYAAVMDEASRTKEDAWFAVRSTLTFTKGPIRIIGNVKGRRNWFYNLARKAERGEEANFGYHKITAIDAVAAHVLEAEEVEDAKKVLPEAVFKELYLAEPSDDQGNPFGLKAIAACVSKIQSVQPGVVPVVHGVDFAKSQDWTVDIGLDEHGRTCKFIRMQIGWEAQYPILHASLGTTPTLADSTGVGDPVVERLQKKPGAQVEGYKFSSQSKQLLMEGLAIAIQSGEVSFPDAPDGVLPHDHPGHIRRELEQFEYEYTRTGVRYSAPSGFHDDCVMALALAVMHRTHARLPMKISKSVLARVQGMRR
jgi:phage FluMu gp28-like protein